MHFRTGFGRSVGVALGLLYLSDSALSVPSGEEGRWKSKRAKDPCAEIASSWDSGENIVNAEMAYACLTSVPFDSKRAVYIARQMRLFTQIYSAQTFFYDPPTPELRIKRVDLNGTFDEIEQKAATKDGYPNDYIFQTDLMKLYNSFHDGHVNYIPSCAVSFPFFHNYPLIEIYNGKDLPSIYTADPVTGDLRDEIVEINGEEVHKHLERLALELPDLGWIDPDARYNTLLLSKNPQTEVAYGTFAQRTFYDEHGFKMKTKDGKEIDVQWQAYIPKQPIFSNSREFEEMACLDPDYAGIENQKREHRGHLRGGSEWRNALKEKEISREINLYRRQISEKRTGSGKLTSRKTSDSMYWPQLDLAMSGTEQSIHILSAETAVWGIHAFEDKDQSDSFFAQWNDFMDKAIGMLKKRGIKRILIDVSNNGGGFVALGITSIRKFFPESQPYYGFDIRRSPALDLLIEYSADADQSHLTLNMSRDINNNEFTSIQEFLGPVHKYGDYFTNMGRWDVANTIGDTGLNIPTSGDPPFSIDDIVLLSDGKCGSTCAIFSEAIQSLGAKAITFNGIPDEAQDKKEMQAVGGVKGSQVWDWDTFQSAHVEKFIPNPEQYDFLPKRLPIQHYSSMNLRNSYEAGSGLPLEFTWQPSSAHLYTTKEMWDDRAELWKAAMALAWDKDGKNILPPPPASQGGDGDASGPNGDNTDDYGLQKWGYYIALQFNSSWTPELKF
ncbi:hypothetical protein L211DRAFT_819393 [Terfezia boudieri ATCC MYA-4762]|uniref:CPAF-like PDZ domain-containing protein n=1 Tax=Terfezia boudieri ATCC MYA-4762 TaxID=1051890 RepID=A0A3N4LX61_9PEZI|nr:hypothetical protein L211DRAFT_819393 [Terfezia boudieri ATCC MYA-4762]